MMRLIYLILFLLIQACSDPRLDNIPSNGVILAFGDSLTYGIGTAKPHSYPEVLAKLTGRKVINAGISGEVTQQGLARFPSVLDQYRPHTVILLQGGNDILRNYDLQQTKQNIKEMIQIARDRGIQIVLIAVPEKKLFSNTAGFYHELADEFELVFDKDLIASLLRQPKYKSDTVHFNQAGYTLMAERIHQLLKDNGGL